MVDSTIGAYLVEVFIVEVQHRVAVPVSLTTSPRTPTVH